MCYAAFSFDEFPPVSIRKKTNPAQKNTVPKTTTIQPSHKLSLPHFSDNPAIEQFQWRKKRYPANIGRLCCFHFYLFSFQCNSCTIKHILAAFLWPIYSMSHIDAAAILAFALKYLLYMCF